MWTLDRVGANTELTCNFGILSSVFGIFRYYKYRRRYRHQYLKISDIDSIFRYTDPRLVRVRQFCILAKRILMQHFSFKLSHLAKRQMLMIMLAFYSLIYGDIPNSRRLPTKTNALKTGTYPCHSIKVPVRYSQGPL